MRLKHVPRNAVMAGLRRVMPRVLEGRVLVRCPADFDERRDYEELPGLVPYVQRTFGVPSYAVEVVDAKQGLVYVHGAKVPPHLDDHVDMALAIEKGTPISVRSSDRGELSLYLGQEASPRQRALRASMILPSVSIEPGDIVVTGNGHSAAMALEVSKVALPTGVHMPYGKGKAPVLIFTGLNGDTGAVRDVLGRYEDRAEADTTGLRKPIDYMHLAQTVGFRP